MKRLASFCLFPVGLEFVISEKYMFSFCLHNITSIAILASNSVVSVQSFGQHTNKAVKITVILMQIKTFSAYHFTQFSEFTE